MKRFLILLLLIATTARAAELTVQVQGMVCSFCAQGLSKIFKAEKVVETFKVDLDEKLVKIKLKEGETMSDEKVKALITEAGYNVEKIERK